MGAYMTPTEMFVLHAAVPFGWAGDQHLQSKLVTCSNEVLHSLFCGFDFKTADWQSLLTTGLRTTSVKNDSVAAAPLTTVAFPLSLVG